MICYDMLHVMLFDVMYCCTKQCCGLMLYIKSYSFKTNIVYSTFVFQFSLFTDLACFSDSKMQSKDENDDDGKNYCTVQ